ncbi:VCBS repeat-containing protein [Aureisphaera sp. CAU 1614]|uniref:VCBS repeat-containing protein n=1 Tax=Halomarinibacterium sedimenti TaxID=2857106 RepID=A0A9X1FR68_9FLAO|nr:VCBS repeat-containing protein [Halomarinibacterium sedimenti]MBW2939126.1 VCBS repeat-containing protein [Halomarinibacterium sedimenti]
MKPVLALFCGLLLLLSCNDSKTDTNSATDEVMPLFKKLDSDKSGIAFRNSMIQTADFNFMNYMYIYTGAGVAAGDIDNDGLIDLYFVSNAGPNKLYKNKGNLKFEDITTTSQTEDYTGFSTGVSMWDANGDGWLDIYVCKAGSLGDDNGRRNLLFINNKNGTFTESAKTFGLDSPGYSTQAYPIDYDRDGDLDLYLVNHRYDFQNNGRINSKIQAQIEENTSDQLFRNDGNSFTNVTLEAGLVNKAWGLSGVISDFNNDGWDDIYVANDFMEPDFLYINQKNGTFKNEINERMKHISNFSMGSDFADLNNDLHNDLVTLDMVSESHVKSKENMASMSTPNFLTMVKIGYHHQYMTNTLQWGDSQGNFRESALMSGIAKTDWSWAPLLADFDNDGYKDIFIANGVDRDYTNQDARNKLKEVMIRGESMTLDSVLNSFPSQPVENYIYQNNGDLTFTKKSNEWGLEMPTYSYGASYADLDNDGDLDLIVNNLNAECGIFENQSQNKYLQIKLQGPNKNIFGVGSKVFIETEKGQQKQELFLNRGYESSVTPILNFGLGNSEEVKRIGVIWPDGKISEIGKTKSNQLVTIDYNKAKTGNLSFETTRLKKKAINPIDLGINYKHVENTFDDYALQLLIPQKQSSKGTKLTVGDVNGDGLEDFFVGNAGGNTAALYIQKTDGSFLATNENLWQSEKQYEDANALFFDADNDGDLDLYVVSAGYELKENSPLLQDRLYTNDGKGNFKKDATALPKMLVSGKAIAVSDIDGDNDLDIFVGGNVVPGKYPLTPQSFLLKNEGGKFVDVTSENQELANVGMISEVLFTDYDGDNDKDLLLVGEWMTPTLFKNNQGSFSKDKAAKGLENLEGWWFSATQADLDGDGDIDYILGNLGANNKFHPSKEKPLFISAKDFDNNGTFDVAMSKISNGKVVPVRGKECSSQQNPFLLDKIKTYKEFAHLEFKDIYGEDELKDAFKLQAHEFESVLVFNEGNGNFKVVHLPNDAQMGPTMATLVKDINGDGNLDILGVGGLYDAEVETVRYDGNFGYVLLGDGNGNYVAEKQYEPYIPFDAKDVKQVTIGGVTHYVVVSNNSHLEVFTYQL